MATTGSHGAPHIVPVGFRLDPGAETIQIGGRGMSKSKKWRDLQANPKIAFVVDDLASTDPWTPRGIVIRGSAELHHEGGEQHVGGGWDSAPAPAQATTTAKPAAKPAAPKRAASKPATTLAATQ